ncbi:DNA methyltransferase [Salegentibacter sediminis]|uniref:DNA methyltransferase n=1 Tax=Salegentibacter sediminis TaxID=1930251 RepID=UPI0009BF431A|nr:DNA methyltransferase [Salegentibacter sediminis]
MKYNDLDIKKWKESDINVDSLWIIEQREKSGKHSNVYHGNFIPQIPNQLIRRYTRNEEIVLDPFLGSGTTLYEAENLNRNFIGFDINEDIFNFVKNNMKNSSEIQYSIKIADVTSQEEFDNAITTSLESMKAEKVHYVLMHPPYLDIIKFTSHKNDLSQISDTDLFINKMLDVIKNCLSYLEKERYFSIVIGDVYKKGEVIPLSSLIINAVKQKFQVKLKGIVVKNIAGNRAKQGKGGIWRYRALNSDYYIFKHEYILTFKKMF